ncbi:hypothetical protein [Maribellus maritimus]|uniref:hypothetical protein n=1 Tax=Maribellus maritimus TaxID=2870838 RepID=UPI001EE9C2EE|nr:hypothetical protein [Maribellus maritimus]MCG6189212.1 hypothetical protein [Maribellus maritimus]
MKKIIFIISVFTIFLMVSKQSSAYSGWVECDEAAGDPYQITVSYHAGGNVHYTLFVDHGAAYVGVPNQYDSIYDEDGSTTKLGVFHDVAWPGGSLEPDNLFLTACHLGNNENGYAKVTATW